VTYIVATGRRRAARGDGGDALFAGSIGRGNQSWDWRNKKCANRFCRCRGNADLSRHGPLTTVAEERNTIRSSNSDWRLLICDLTAVTVIVTFSSVPAEFMRHTISVLVENKFGVLTRVAAYSVVAATT